MSETATRPADAPRQTASAGAACVLEARGLFKIYAMGRATIEVLRDCSLRVREGEFLAVMGKSGSGKSTLLHILGALDVPQRGQVFFDGRPVFAPESRRRLHTGLTDVLRADERRRNALRARAFGFVFQFYHLLPELSVLENVLLPKMVACGTLRWFSQRRQARREALAILERLGLGGRIRHKPAELSGGERQRVAIARALIHKPRVLLADEPTGNLDAETGEQILQIFDDLHAEGQTIVMVTHDAGVAARADRICVLRDGRLHPAGD